MIRAEVWTGCFRFRPGDVVRYAAGSAGWAVVSRSLYDDGRSVRPVYSLVRQRLEESGGSLVERQHEVPEAVLEFHPSYDPDSHPERRAEKETENAVRKLWE